MPNFLLFNKESDRLFFREVIPSDFQDWLPFHEDPLSNQFWSGLPKDPILACEEQFSKIKEPYSEGSGGINALVSMKTNKLIELAGLLVQTVNSKEELEISYSILPEYWRQGFAFEAIEKCKSIAFENQWAESLISIIQIDNIPSQKTALKNGMSIDYETTYKDNPVYIFRINR